MFSKTTTKRRTARLGVQALEAREVPAGLVIPPFHMPPDLAGGTPETARVLTLPAMKTQAVSDYLPSAADVDMYKVTLHQGDFLAADLHATSSVDPDATIQAARRVRHPDWHQQQPANRAGPVPARPDGRRLRPGGRHLLRPGHHRGDDHRQRPRVLAQPGAGRPGRQQHGGRPAGERRSSPRLAERGRGHAQRHRADRVRVLAAGQLDQDGRRLDRQLRGPGHALPADPVPGPDGRRDRPPGARRADVQGHDPHERDGPTRRADRRAGTSGCRWPRWPPT